MAQASHLKNLRYGKKQVLFSMLLLIGLTLIKAFGGYMTNAVALLGDAAASFGDMIAMIAIFVGISFSLRAPDKRFKYGYHRLETFISLIIAIGMVYFGYRILRASIEQIYDPQPIKLAVVGILTTLIAIGVSFFSYYHHYRIAEKINSAALMASAVDKRNDAFISMGVLGGIVANTFNIPLADKIIGIGIALMVLFLGLRSLKDALLYLLDYWDNPEMVRQIDAIIRKSTIVTGIKKIRLRHAGTFIFGEAFLEVNPFTDIIDLRDEIHKLDEEIKRKIAHLGDFVLYVDPPKPKTMTVAIPIQEDHGLESKIADNFHGPFFFLIIQINNRHIKKMTAEKDRIFKINQSLKIVNFLKSKKINILVSSHIRALLYYNLRLNNIKVYPHFSNVADVNHTVKLLLLDI